MLVVSGRVPFKETSNHHITHPLRKKKAEKIESSTPTDRLYGGDFVGFLGGYLDQLGSSNGELLVDAGIPGGKSCTNLHHLPNCFFMKDRSNKYLVIWDAP